MDRHPSAGAAAAQPPGDPHRALLDSGWQELRYANWPKARDLLEQAIAESPKTEIKAEAMYALATLWQIRQPGGSYAEAERLYARVAREFPDTPAAPWALLALARLADMPEYERDRNVDLARQLYREVLQRYADHVVADEATLRLAMTYLEKIGDTASEDIGAAMLARCIAEKPKNYLVYAMHLVLGDLAQRRQEYPRAVGHWIAADPGIIGASDRAALYYKIGYTAEHNLKDYALAGHWYDRIVTDVKRENRYYIAKVAAERCRGLAAQAGQAAPAAPGAPASEGTAAPGAPARGGTAAPGPAKEGAP